MQQGFTPDSPEYRNAVDQTVEQIRLQIKMKVAQGYTPERIYLYLRDTVDEFREMPEYTQNITCGTSNDCSFCCHSDIPIGKIEADYIKKVIEEKNIKPNYKRLHEQMTNPNPKWMAKACPLLLDENTEGKRLCSIYEDRPIICRIHNSNEEPKECDRSEDPHKIVKETRGSVMDALMGTVFLVNPDPRKIAWMLHEVIGEMFEKEYKAIEKINEQFQMAVVDDLNEIPKDFDKEKFKKDWIESSVKSEQHWIGNDSEEGLRITGPVEYIMGVDMAVGESEGVLYRAVPAHPENSFYWGDKGYTGPMKMELIRIGKSDPTKCTQCGKDHGLRDEDAGSAQEELRMCNECFNQINK